MKNALDQIDQKIQKKNIKNNKETIQKRFSKMGKVDRSNKRLDLPNQNNNRKNDV
jgi:hypothetical protein